MPEVSTESVLNHSDVNIQQKQMDIVTGFTRKLRNNTTSLRTLSSGRPYLYLKAINGPATLAALTYSDGATLSVGDVIPQGDFLEGPIASYQLSGGTVIEFYL